MEGETTQINCNFYMSVGISHVTVKWEKDNKTLSTTELKYQSITNASSALKLKSLHQNQSGLYKCKVQVKIPLLREGEGTGTNVTVTGKASVFFFL